MRVVLSYTSEVPIYEQVKEQIKASILSGELCEGDSLPPIRQLARDLKVSVMTTTRAYSDLELEGFVSTLPKKGVYVKKVDSATMRKQYVAEVKTALKTAIRRGKLAGIRKEELHALLASMEETENESCN